ncbi:MAG TPA: glucosyl-3-phosphoglycerate synthase [Kiritimatiellia bacterium]|jgi:glucosyl-3-phosphoglycerate synthase
MKTAVWLKRLFGKQTGVNGDTSRRLNGWLSSHTFRCEQFADLKGLVAEKQKRGVTISLCLPTLNEEKTIGKEVVLLKSELMTRNPLLDEIAVFDSGSTDRTREIAAEYGADVYLSRDILPDLGEKKGKGENLWKAIYQLKGDIIVYIDTDIANIRPHFVYGLVGPLLHNPEIQYVKGYYDRPLLLKQGQRVPGGGRVTEILVRPLFSLYFPELTALIQPLSGEYAARREALEQIAFPVGYGVETAHLLDVYRQWGLTALAQTDLGQRIHRNQDTSALGRMSFGILQTFHARLRRYGLARGDDKFNTVLRQFTGRDDGHQLTEQVIEEDERPPMISIDAYQEKFGRRP